ncbi:MAG: hypothetical protein ABW098_20835, partial [Candidatus Thiodiazotropha sp.]
ALQFLLLIPLAAVGALLVYAGIDLAKSKELAQGSWEELSVIIITALVCLLLNVALGLLAGILVEYLRGKFGKQPSI